MIVELVEDYGLIEEDGLAQGPPLLHELSEPGVKSILLTGGEVTRFSVAHCHETFLWTLTVPYLAGLQRSRLGSVWHQRVGLIVDMIEQLTRLSPRDCLHTESYSNTMTLGMFLLTFSPNFFSSALSSGVSMRL